MKRFAFYEENGKCKIELQKATPVKPVNDGKIKWKLMPDGIEEMDAYLQIFFHRSLDQEELFDLYAVLVDHNIIKMTREEMNKSIQEDLQKQPMGKWELKSNFRDVFECAIRLGNDILFHDHAFTFQISDTPTGGMKAWLELKEEENDIKALAEKFKVNDFDTEFYHDESAEFYPADKLNEMTFIRNLIEAMTLKGASDDEIRNIVMYSMVVIDAGKKQLNWRQAAIDFRVQEMCDKYMPEGSEHPHEKHA